MLQRIGFLIFILSVCVDLNASTPWQELRWEKDNPGELSASMIAGKVNTAPLFVLLHGCTQEGQILAEDSRLADLALNSGATLLVPQQSESNHLKMCFNWFNPADHRRGQGEHASLTELIKQVQADRKPSATYLIGLSAGGAMAAALVSQEPQLFDAVAIVAGIPYPCADSLGRALSCMKDGPADSLHTMVSQVLALQQHDRAQLPAMIFVSGDQDLIVNPRNAYFASEQWLDLLDLEGEPQRSDTSTARISEWSNDQHSVTLVQVSAIGHGWPSSGNSERDPYILKNVFDLSDYLAQRWLSKQP